MNFIKKFLVALSFLVSTPALAFDHEDLVHLTAHVGASYILQTSFYGLNNRVFKLNKTESEALAFVSTMIIGFGYKMLENSSQADINRAMAQDVLGSALAIATHVTFRF